MIKLFTRIPNLVLGTFFTKLSLKMYTFYEIFKKKCNFVKIVMVDELNISVKLDILKTYAMMFTAVMTLILPSSNKIFMFHVIMR